MKIEKIKREAELAGYELARAEESISETGVFGLLIFVHMSNRKLRSEDNSSIHDAAEGLRKGLEYVTAKTHPEAEAMRAAMRKQFVGIYEKAGVGTVYLEEIQNRYCNEACCLNRPWYRITSEIGHVIVGWRKRVISIDWEDTVIKKSGEELFPGEDVTRWETGIHAWGIEKATEYIQRLHRLETK